MRKTGIYATEAHRTSVPVCRSPMGLSVAALGDAFLDDFGELIADKREATEGASNGIGMFAVGGCDKSILAPGSHDGHGEYERAFDIFTGGRHCRGQQGGGVTCNESSILTS